MLVRPSDGYGVKPALFMRQVRAFFRSVWFEPRAPHPPRRVRMDWVLVAAFAALGSLEVAIRRDLPWRIASLVLCIGLLPTLLWRRTRPLRMVVIAFGQKIAPHIVDHPRLGSINLHGSRLPKYRGAAPINWAIINGESFTGNSVIRVAAKMDAPNAGSLPVCESAGCAV